ncbi:nucleoside deaminase [Rhodococcoides kyotonense]|uniref:Cytidine and deoxycytidylate deaminase zinc-binding region n=1 Tax=Rhodococcoides kyotonense TaxID=398843 RepID=A0A239EZV9_9NOCA|nr:nucleoside deaminase [Rhodococcus kyotonensis]SNS49828.1 Cytidine and deoxycytidylate deaminase zinc-binding region [Rhodococcus kyotonensis]
MSDTHLRRAIALAVEAGERGNRPFGAVLVGADGTVLAEGRNEVASAGDVTAHAELVAIRAASTAEGATMYASGEPCPMCSAAMVWAGIARIVFGASEPEFSKLLEGGPRFSLRCADVVAAADVSITVEGPVDESEALVPFRPVRAK